MSISWLPRDLYERDQNEVLAVLAECLVNGSLALFLGSGVSSGLGLPKWKTLVERCADIAAIPIKPGECDTTEGILEISNRIEESPGVDFPSVVHQALYKDSKDGAACFLNQHLLIAIGSLVMKARRGSVSEVLTFNFDDVLERYLRLHGCSSQVISQLPTLMRSTDVTVYHPHGFLPLDYRLRDGALIFSGDSFDTRLGSALDPWTHMTSELLLRRVGLFIGLSPDGPNLGPLMTQVRTKLNETRPSGFWFVASENWEAHCQKIVRWHGIPIKVNNYSDIPLFLLRVCQQAGAGL